MVLYTRRMRKFSGSCWYRLFCSSVMFTCDKSRFRVFYLVLLLGPGFLVLIESNRVLKSAQFLFGRFALKLTR